MALTRRKLVGWLLSNDFEELSGKKTSHRQFKHQLSGVVVTVEGKGRPELSKKHHGMVLKQIEKAGFNKDQVRRELG